jgi:uncharacterized protein YggE
MNAEYTALMVKRWSLLLLILFVPAAFAQLDSNSVTVTATRSMSPQPDQAVFAVTVQSGLSTNLDDVVAALQGSGITAANFSGISMGPALVFTGNPIPAPPVSSIVAPPLQWVFALPAPLAKINDTIATLIALQKSIAQQNKGLTLSFSVQGTQVSAQLQQSQVCSTPDLLTDARTRAQKLANAAGLTLGTVLALSSGPSISGSVGSPTSISSFLLGSASPSVCSLTVKFALLRY